MGVARETLSRIRGRNE
ncbi:hypothetical protein [Pedobacter sp. WC2423]